MDPNLIIFAVIVFFCLMYFNQMSSFSPIDYVTTPRPVLDDPICNFQDNNIVPRGHLPGYFIMLNNIEKNQLKNNFGIF
jgi:hypothetical protein